jgi:hypothetical protein
MIRTYSELIKLDSFIERYRYLKLSGKVGEDTFGFDRWLNQKFYKSPEYRKVRREVILRDNGCDLGDPEFEIAGRVIIHHMNPITQTDILERSDFALDPEYMICVSHGTHNAIHYGDESQLPINDIVIRRPNDQAPWKRSNQ